MFYLNIVFTVKCRTKKIIMDNRLYNIYDMFRKEQSYISNSTENLLSYHKIRINDIKEIRQNKILKFTDTVLRNLGKEVTNIN